MPERNERIIKIENGSHISHSVEDSLWKRDCGINLYIYSLISAFVLEFTK